MQVGYEKIAIFDQCLNQSINQSINQKRIRVTKVTDVTARPLCLASWRIVNGATVRFYKQSAAGSWQFGDTHRWSLCTALDRVS